MKNGFSTLLCIVFLLDKGVTGLITNTPLNAVAEIGQQAIFNCTSDRTLQNWIFTTKRDDLETPSAQVIVLNCEVQPEFKTRYEVDRPGGSNNACNLIVKTTSLEQAGVYTCTDIGLGYSAILTVIESLPVITLNSNTTVVESEVVIIACALNYNGSASTPTLRPYFYWTYTNGQNVSSSNDSTTENSAVTWLKVTAGRENITSYTCHVDLKLIPPTAPGHANNTPTVKESASSPTIEVLYNSSTPNITISGVCGTIILTCNSSGNPPPNYKWFYWNKTGIDIISERQILNLTEVNQSYICEAYNTIRNVKYTASSNYSVSQSDHSSHCNTDPNSPGKTDLIITTIVLAAVLGGYGLCNIIATIAFLVYYNRKSNTVSDDKEMSTFRNKSKLNARFPWLQRMLPCMNESRGNAGCTFLWVILFILMSILTGIIVFPILVAMVNCSRKRKDSKENSDIDMSNQKRSKTAGNPSTAAHGDFEDPYDEIRTMQPVRKQTLEEPTSAKNTNAKDAKKVFYTRVNPNLNTGEDIDRYCVSMPRGSPES